MFILAISLAVLSVLYGLAWHKEPAEQPAVLQRRHHKAGVS